MFSGVSRKETSGKANPFLAGVSMVDFDLSPDAREVAFTSRIGKDAVIFLAPLDASAPPRQVVRGGDSVSFGAPGELFFCQLGLETNYLARIRTDGGGAERVMDQSIMDKGDVSPSGAWVMVTGIGSAKLGTFAVWTRDRTLKVICPSLCLASWSADRKSLYMPLGPSPTSEGTTLVFPFLPARNCRPCPKEDWVCTLVKTYRAFG